MDSVLQVFKKIFGTYALLLILCGTISSLMSFYICIRLKQNPTFIFLSFLTVSNIVSLYFWNLDNFLQAYLNIDLLNYDLWLCKFGSFYQFTSLQISAWLLVNITIKHLTSSKESFEFF
jgi:hypothetical protein